MLSSTQKINANLGFLNEIDSILSVETEYAKHVRFFIWNQLTQPTKALIFKVK